jgi:hypothetical protein
MQKERLYDMFQQKRILLMLIASGLLASCGGGGSSEDTAATSAGSTGTTGTTTTTASAPVGTTAGTSSGPTPTATGGQTATPGTTSASGSTDTSSPGSAPGPVAAADPQFNGYFEMVADQVLYIRTNRVLYHPVPFPQFESDSGLVDVASGSTQAPPVSIDISGCNLAKDGMCGVQPPAAAPDAPIAAFGLRINKFLKPLTTAQSIVNQSVTGRIAFDLTERTDSPGIAAGEVPEIMRFVIDNVKMSTDENGQISSVEMGEGAQIHVYGRNAAGVEIQDDIPAPAGTVRLLPVSQIPDSATDNSSVVLLMDLETGFSQADAKLASLAKLAGHFAMRLTLSFVPKIVRPAAPATADYPGVDEKELVGQSIVVNNQPPVTGAGIVGNTWIRMFP